MSHDSKAMTQLPWVNRAVEAATAWKEKGAWARVTAGHASSGSCRDDRRPRRGENGTQNPGTGRAKWTTVRSGIGARLEDRAGGAWQGVRAWGGGWGAGGG